MIIPASFSLCFAFILGSAVIASAAGQAAAEKPRPAPVALAFRVQTLHLDNNEACAVADYDRDGFVDISAGEFWYRGPDFTEKRPLRTLRVVPADYLSNNGEHAYDVNGDGWTDIVTGSFTDTELVWYENPGKAGLASGQPWKRHVLIDTKLGKNELTLFHDLDGDGRPEVVINSYDQLNPVMAYTFSKSADGRPVLLPWEIHPRGQAVNGHGIGFGDINGDGREDIIYGNGWYERPGGDDRRHWTRHPDWRFPYASAPMLVVDLSGDGRKDIIWGHGHNYGLYWEEQRDRNQDGSTNWRRHVIDEKFSQAHALVWEDLDGDGEPELITGRRHKAHSGRDPGDNDPGCLYYFKWNPATRQFKKFVIAENGPGIGLQIRLHDLDGNGTKDIVVAGKGGTFVVWNEGRR